MAEATNAFIVDMLRPIRVDIGDLEADQRKAKLHLGWLEADMAHLQTRGAHLHIEAAEIPVRMDRRDDLIERITRRLESTEHQS